MISTSVKTLYRIIDLDDDRIVASGISSRTLAQQTLEQYQLNYPRCKFEIDTYTTK